MIKYLKQYEGKTFTELVNSLIWFDLPFKLKAIFAKLYELISSNSPKYKVYTALLTQSGTDAPVATVLENTLGDITFSYEDVGIYNIVSSNLFIENKTHFLLTNNTYTLGTYPSFNSFDYIGISTLRIVTTDPLNSLNTDDNLYNTPIEIRVYN